MCVCARFHCVRRCSLHCNVWAVERPQGLFAETEGRVICGLGLGFWCFNHTYADCL